MHYSFSNWKEPSRPLLVQRCGIRQPFLPKQTLAHTLKLDYMGSAEFEWGAVPAAIEKMAETVELYEVKEETSLFEKPLHIFWPSYSDFYLQEIYKIYTSGGRLKEWSGFQRDHTYLETDFWFDIRNLVMWSYDKAAIENAKDMILETVRIWKIEKT